MPTRCEEQGNVPRECGNSPVQPGTKLGPLENAASLQEGTLSSLAKGPLCTTRLCKDPISSLQDRRPASRLVLGRDGLSHTFEPTLLSRSGETFPESI